MSGLKDLTLFFKRWGGTGQIRRDHEARRRINQGADPMEAWMEARGLDLQSPDARRYKIFFSGSDPDGIAYACQALKIIPAQLLTDAQCRYAVPAFIMNASVILRDVFAMRDEKNGALIRFFIHEESKKDILGKMPTHKGGEENAACLRRIMDLYDGRTRRDTPQAFVCAEDVTAYIHMALDSYYTNYTKNIKQRDSILTSRKRQAPEMTEAAHSFRQWMKTTTTARFLAAYANCLYAAMAQTQRMRILSQSDFLARAAERPRQPAISAPFLP